MNKLALSLALITAVALFSCKDKPPPPNPPTPVNLITVKTRPVTYYDKYPATSQALSQVDLRAQVAGYITGIFFVEGTHVHKGQKLYSIDERLYKAAYDQAAANVKVAEGTRDQAQQDADRYDYLSKHNAIAKQVVDHAVITLQNAKNSVQAAQEAVKTAATNLTYSTITAPFDGTIGYSQVKLGNVVTVGQTVLNTISTDNPMAVDFLINEAQLARYERLRKGKAAHPDSLFTLVMPDHTLYPNNGKISVIDRAVDPQTGTLRIRIVFDNPQQDLRAGMSCVVRVHNQETAPQMMIPARAIVEQMGEYFVYIAKDTVIDQADSPKDKDGANHPTTGAGSDSANVPKLRAFQIKVETGQTIDPDIEIKSGLKDGDKVVVDGVQALHDGSTITTANKQGPAAAGGRGR